MRRHVLRLQLDDLKIRLATGANLTEAAQAAIAARIADDKRQDAALTGDPVREPEKREGLDQLWEKAKAIEAERDLAMRKDPYFDYAQALLQISIVLASVAMIAGGNLLLVVGAVLAVVGIFMGIEGFTLFWLPPFFG